MTTHLDELDTGLRALVEGTASVTGEAFFRSLVRGVATALAVRWAFVAEFAGVRTRVRMLANWDHDHFAPEEEFDLSGTPCEAVLCGEPRHYPQGVAALFPRNTDLAVMGAESYLAIPLRNAAGDVLGHLAVLDERAMPAAPRELALFQVFAARAAAELERVHTERALREREARLAAILGSALDAVVCIDGARRVTFVNPAAERVLGCCAADVVGTPLERFLAPSFRALLDHHLAAPAAARPSLWVPQGIEAVRADGSAFPAEATLSCTRVDGCELTTLILRDLNDRHQAEAALARLRQEKAYLQAQVVGEAHEIVGASAAIRELRTQLDKVAATDATVLLLGETGTGKELLARYTHRQSPRRERMLVKMNCAALPSELIESELFGHEKGAFSGAIATRKGRFELADGGTLFLDEVGELSLPAQAKLLRVLQEREFERVGGTRPIHVDVRVVAATNRDLAQMVEQGQFRADLYYRLNVFPLQVPPLRARHDDIPALVAHVLGGLQRRLGKPLHGVTARALAALLAYPWPGNIRELQNVVERAAILATDALIDEADLGLAPVRPTFAVPPLPAAAPLPAVTAGETPPGADAASLEAVERRHIEATLERCGGVIEGPKGAAAALEMHPSTLRSRLQKLGIRARRR
ncbi:sigma-54 interaction domain-containing protein [Plasticicumulans lactativorans]|uniref:sigma-54 interaction domain-containing protein n=1 Tax=Plasticicumulans lactativorans TaxID=1133106 RepID=UPI001FB2E4EC|nr:sigma 54-interacting transcriptional regulator [Plasticicumulans lactativorans]